MPGQVRVLCGTPRSERARTIDRLFLDGNAVTGAAGRNLLLVPTRHHATRRTEDLILDHGLPGLWGRAVLTFDDFVVDILRAAGRRPERIRDVKRRALLEQALNRPDSPSRRLGSITQTNGFITHLLQVIAQLKQAAVEPPAFRERVAARSPSNPFDDIVADAYAGYQERLQAAGLYDVPGLFWEADLLCRQGRPTALEGVRSVLLDGFDDFTPSEFRLLSSLVPHVDQVVFGINCSSDPSKKDLYAIPMQTVRAIHDAFGAELTFLDDAAPSRCTEFAAAHLFWRDRPEPPNDLVVDIEIIPCANSVQEVETIARRVKSLLLEGVPSSEISVVYRDLSGVATTLRAVFAECGVPAHILHEPRLWTSSVCAWLLGFLESSRTWERDAIADSIDSPWFAPRGTVHQANTTASIARAAQIISGYEEWRKRLDTLEVRLAKDAGDDSESVLRGIPDAAETLADLRGRVDALRALQRLIPADGSLDDFAHAIDGILEQAGVDAAVEAYPDPHIRDFEQGALTALRGLMAEWSTLRQDEGGTYSLTTFLTRFRRMLQETPVHVSQPRNGVLCLDAESARHLRFDYVFFAGVNEGDVPSPAPSNAIYSENDISDLARAGIPIEGKRRHIEHEALLFHHVIEMPRRRLCVTWSRLSWRGKEQFPSPYVSDLAGLFPGLSITQPPLPMNGFVPEPEAAGSWRDLRNAAYSRIPALRPVAAARFPSVQVGVSIENARHDRNPFGIYDGVIGDPNLKETIARWFDDAHRFSISQLETYAACPFRFFVERILRIDETETPVEEFDPRVRGTLMHDALRAFHERYRGRAIADIPFDEATVAMRECVTAVFADKAWRSQTAPRGTLGVEERRLNGLLERYLRIERDRDDPVWKPAHFEVSFGEPPKRGMDTPSTPQPFSLRTNIGHVLFSGRIDRIDGAGNAESEARIIDYKSSIMVKKQDLDEGTSLQLQIYALALEELLLQGVRCAQSVFLRVGFDERLEGMGRSEKNDVWPEREAAARDAVARYVQGIRDGRFPPTRGEGACAHCRAKGACRYEEGRITRKGASV